MEQKILNVYPEIEGGDYSVKCEVDRDFKVSCAVTADHKAKVTVRYRKKGSLKWKNTGMALSVDAIKYAFRKDYNSFQAIIQFSEPGIYEYQICVGKEKYRILSVIVETVRARFASWYEIFPRSQGYEQGKSATFKDCENRLDDIKNMGFDVLYLTPIHPIGFQFRKGANNSTDVQDWEPGCPWSIGNENGGHKSIQSDLGTIEDFGRLVKKAKKMGFEIALDIAFQTSADHPYMIEHPDWYHYRKDGTIAYAENPPKKYQDVYPLNFYPPDKEEMWNEMKSIITFWAKNGVTQFRIDNPHTKPTEFWRWLISEVKMEYPESVFLSESFTNYEKLEELAKIGFSQSYTYFTWRNKKDELIEYGSRLTKSYLKNFLRANFFTNTPDICPPIIQNGERSAFKMRFALASTMSSAYGMYSGFELCDGWAFEGTENYRDSEKYQYKVWDWNRQGNIKEYIKRINFIRNENPALHLYDNIKFLSSTCEHILFYCKITPDRSNSVLVAVNLKLNGIENSRLTFPLEKMGIPTGSPYKVRELITGRTFISKGNENYVRMDPNVEPAYIFVVEPLGENDISDDMKNAYKWQDVQHFAGRFFYLREQIVYHNDVYAGREFADIFNNNIAPRVYFGPNYDPCFTYGMNEMSRKIGFDSIIKAFITTPGK
ncbi:DUF3416 domain-containing protein [bacterium]|nr:DUF3416 domain-containing protein [bacterium]